MSFDAIIGFLKDFLVLIVVFFALLGYGTWFGRRSLIILVFSLYLALLVSLQFPYYDKFTSLAPGNSAYLSIGLFLVFLYAGYRLFDRYVSETMDWGGFKTFELLVLVVAATPLLMVFAYHVLPITEVVDFNSHIDKIFSSKEYFFWWLMAPLGILFFLG